MSGADAVSTGGERRRLLRAGEANAYEPLALPIVDAGGAERAGRALPLTASALEALQREVREEAHREGHAEGYARGYREGLGNAQTQMRPRLELLQSLLSTLGRPLDELDERIEDVLVTLALACAEHVVRREVRTDPALVVSAAREALRALPFATGEVRIYVNELDVGLLTEALRAEPEEQPWRVVADPGMARGGCRVESDVSRIDSSIETRMQAIVGQVLGGERDEEGGLGGG